MAKAKAKQNSVRADGRVKVSLDIGRATGGKRTRKYFYGRTMDEAEAKRAAYMDAHPPEAPSDHRDDTLAQWADYWYPLYNSGIAKRTTKSREIALSQIKSFDIGGGVTLGSMRLADIRPSHCRAYLNSREGKCKSGISLHKNMLSHMFDAAAQERVIRESPCVGMKSPKAGKYVGHRDLSETEQGYIVAAHSHHRSGLWAMIMMYAGLRLEEVTALKWERIDLEAGNITVDSASEMNSAGEVKDVKTAAGARTIPIVKPLRVALERVPMDKRVGLVCRNASGGHLTLTSYRQAWRSFMLVCLRVANGLQPFEATQGWAVDKTREKFASSKKQFVEFSCTAHDLRYTCATIMYDAGVDVKTAAYLLGHKDILVTMRIYTKLSERKRNASVDKLLSHFDA